MGDTGIKNLFFPQFSGEKQRPTAAVDHRFPGTRDLARFLQLLKPTKDVQRRPRVTSTADTKVFAMTSRRLATAVLSLVLVASTSVTESAASLLTLYYDAATGNLKLQNTTSSTQGFKSADILTLGDGTIGDASGRVDNIGWLTGSGTANVPPFAFAVSPADFGTNGLNSQVGGANTANTNAFTLDPYAGWSVNDPIGPVGSYWDFGNIAEPGMNQAQLDVRFITDPGVSPGGVSAGGQFLFQNQISPGVYSSYTLGDVTLFQAVPEPSAYAMLISAVACGGWMVRRRRESA